MTPLLLLGLGAAPTASAEEGAWLGVLLQDLSPTLRKAMDLSPEVRGVVVSGVLPDSPAREAGIEEGDLITAIDGRSVDEVEAAVDRVRGMKPGSKVAVTILREGMKKDYRVTLGDRKDREDVMVFDSRRGPQPPRAPRPPRAPEAWEWRDKGGAPLPERHRERMRMFLPGMDGADRGYLGVSSLELSEQLAAYFEVPADRGVLVAEVAEESPAEKAGVRAGDVILAVNKSGVDSPRDLRRLVRAHDPGDQVELEIKRKGATMLLNATLEKTEGIGELLPGRHRILLGELEGNELKMRELEQHLKHLEEEDLPRHMEKLHRHLERLHRLDEGAPGSDRRVIVIDGDSDEI